MPTIVHFDISAEEPERAKAGLTAEDFVIVEFGEPLELPE